ncbi:MAG: hypothetical protein ACKOA8_16425 [Deltaproteobacteria bacterium]
MRKLFVTVTALMVVANLSFAAGKHTGRSGASTTTETVSTSTSTTHLTTGFAMPILPDSGETGLGLAFGVLTQTEASKRLYVGGDFGIHFWGKFAGNGDNSVTAIQLLPTAIYTLESSSAWIPYLGLSAGPYLYLNVLKDTGTTGTSIDFLMVFRPGVYWNIGKKVGLNGEAKFGSLGGALIVMPTVNLSILL